MRSDPNFLTTQKPGQNHSIHAITLSGSRKAYYQPKRSHRFQLTPRVTS